MKFDGLDVLRRTFTVWDTRERSVANEILIVII